MTIKELLNQLNQQRQQSDSYADVKFYFYEVMFQVTRKCNLQCAHCLRGEAQNISMSKEVIDKMLEVSSGIKSIFLSGGEPFLEPDLIEYLVDKIITENYDTEIIATITNGTILNDYGIRCVKALNRFAEWSHTKYGNEETVSLLISSDEYHGNDVDKALEFYKPYIGEYISVSKNELKDGIQRSGRARINNLQSDHPIKYFVKRRIRIDEGNEVPCLLELSPSGNLCVSDMAEWTDCDNHAMGNIMNESLVSMFERNQWEAYRCDEKGKIGVYKNMLWKCEEGSAEWNTANYIIEHLEKVRKWRIIAHSRYPYLTYKEITYMVDTFAEWCSGGEWLKFIHKDYDKVDMPDEKTQELAMQGFVTINNQRKKEGKPKARCVPYDSDQDYIYQCGDR